MPIYFSIDEKMCKEILHPINIGMLDEITEYGPSCQDATLEQLLKIEKGETMTDGEFSSELEEEARGDGISPTLQTVTYVLIILIFIMVAIMCGMETISHCDRKNERI